jgi:hypothetical protein
MQIGRKELTCELIDEIWMIFEQIEVWVIFGYILNEGLQVCNEKMEVSVFC